MGEVVKEVCVLFLEKVVLGGWGLGSWVDLLTGGWDGSGGFGW